MEKQHILSFSCIVFCPNKIAKKGEREIPLVNNTKYSLFVLQVDPPMPTVSYALMGAPGVTMSVPPGAQYNELSEWKKSYSEAVGLEDRIPSRSHSAAAIHFDDHQDKELIKRHNRRHSLSPNFIVNQNNRYLLTLEFETSEASYVG